jgi:fibronectin-binding autotransporter adhesin
MNHVFRTIWSKTLGTWVVASELAAQSGKCGGADKRPRSADAVERFPAAGTRGPWALRLVALAALLALYAPVQAANVYWDPNTSGVGLGGDGTWNTTSSFWNTTGNDVAGPWSTWNNAALDTAIFSGTAGTLSLGAPITANRLTFNVHNYTITGGTLTLAGATPTIDGAGNATINSVIAGTAGLTKAGTGTLTLGGANTFSGGVSVTAGGLTLGSDAALGAAGNGLLMNAGTSLTLNGALNAGRVVTLGGAGQVTVTGVGASGARYTGAGGLSSNVTLSNNANDYTGQTTLTAGGANFTSIGNIGQASSVGAGNTILISVPNGFTNHYSYTGGAASSNRNFQFQPNTLAGGAVFFQDRKSTRLNSSHK